MNKEEIIIGTPVTYWGIIKEDGTKLNPVETEITSEPWYLSHGQLVCKVKGKEGCVSANHLEIRDGR